MTEPRANACVPMMAHESAACLDTRERVADVHHSVCASRCAPTRLALSGWRA